MGGYKVRDRKVTFNLCRDELSDLKEKVSSQQAHLIQAERNGADKEYLDSERIVEQQLRVKRVKHKTTPCRERERSIFV